MVSSETLRISRKLITLALLVGALHFMLSEHNVAVQASTCDSQYGEGIYTCTNQIPATSDQPGMPPLCDPNSNYPPYNTTCTVSYTYTDCKAHQDAVYDQCVLSSGPIGATPLQPRTAPPDPTFDPGGSIIYNKCRNGVVPLYLKKTYDSCIAAGSTKNDCCNVISHISL